MSSVAQLTAIENQLNDIASIEVFLGNQRQDQEHGHLNHLIDYTVNHLSNIRTELRTRIDHLVESIEEEANRRIFEDVDESERPIVPPKIKIKTLKSYDQDKVVEDCCSICMESHLLMKSYTTSCGHHFGVECLNEWIATTTEQHIKATCPLCKGVICQLTGYRVRKVSV